MKKFRTYEISKEFYHMIENIEWPPHLRDQALRAASSVVLEIHYLLNQLRHHLYSGAC